MELRHLRYFVAAAETENVSRAAGRLHVSQPALSRQIRDLEQELGFSLFDRSAKSVRLTGPGKVFLAEARAVLDRAELAVTHARAAAHELQAEIHTGYAPSPTARIVPAALLVSQEQFPKVRVRLHDLSTEEMLTGIREGKLQAALMVRPNRAMLRGLQFEELAREAICLAVPPQHTLAGLRSVPLATAAEQPLLAFSRNDYPEYHEYLQTWFHSVQPKPKIVAEHDSAASLIAAVESGSGAAVVPLSFTCTAGPRLKLIPLAPPPEPLAIGIASAAKGLAPMTARFRDAAMEAAANLK